MTGQEELELFAVFARSSRFTDWLDAQEADNIKILKVADGARLAKAQGKAQFIDEMKSLLLKSKDLRAK
jgi:hypothetical protein